MTREIGSTWRRWDLHIHTPKTIMEDRFKAESKVNDIDLWKLYCEELNEYGATVLGITDYFSVKNYHYLAKNREELGLNKEVILFPNVELRVSDLRSGNPRNTVNLHIIFDNKLSDSEIARFFSNLEVENENGQTLNFNNDFDQIFDGTHIKYLPTSSDVLTALKNGLGTDYKEKALIMVPNGADGISPSPRHGFGSNKDFIQKHVDLINTANLNDVKFYLERAKDDLGRQYPCVSGCDAHSLEEINNYSKEKSTWIKADTSFEGLKSIIFEPELRVYIGETPPDLKADKKIIKNLIIKNEDFGEQTIHFNPYLNTIIGGRSSGKSLLLSILAHKASGETELKKDNDSYNKLISDYVEDTQVTLYDGSPVNKDMILTFIYQDGLQEIAFDDDKRNEFIGDIIGENQKITEYDKSIKSKKSKINSKNSELEKIANKYESLAEENKKIQKESDIEANIQQFNEQLESYKNNLSEKETEEAKEIAEYCKKAEGLIEWFNNQISEQKEILEDEPLIFKPNIQIVYSTSLNNNLDKIIETANKDITEYINRSIKRKRNRVSILEQEIANRKTNKSYTKYLEDQKSNPIKKEIIDKIDKETKRLTTKKKIK